MIDVYFNDIKLDIIVTKDFTAFSGANYDPQISEHSVSDGAEFLFTRKNSKKITVPFYVNYNTVSGYDNLQKILNVKETKTLTFSHIPGRIFYAMPSGDLDFDEIKLNGKGTLTFLIFDGLAHSTAPTPFPFIKNADGVWEATIVNSGSEAVHVTYEVNLKKESGFLGIVSEYGVQQFGKIEEIDGYDDTKSVLLHANLLGDFASWDDGEIFYENQTKKAVTTMTASTTLSGKLGILPTSFTNNGGSQFGAVKELTLSETANDWYIWARAWFETGLNGQTGAWCLAVIDEDNHLIAAMAIEKNDTVGNAAQIRFIVGDGLGGSRVSKTIDFTPSAWFPPNPYGNEGRTKNSNMFDIRKTSEKVTFYYSGGYHSFSDSGIANKKATKVQFFTGQYAGRNTTDRLVTHHYLNDFSFTKLNVPYWKDIPNRYATGSTLKVVGEEGKLYVDNKVTEKDEIIGTNYFKVPPGTTKVQLLISTFGEIESATATIKEAWT